MTRSSYSLPMMAIACMLAILATSCKEKQPASPTVATTMPASSSVSALPNTVDIRRFGGSRPFKVPSQIWHRGRHALEAPPAPLARKFFGLLDATGQGLDVTTASNASGLSMPYDVAVDSHGTLVVANSGTDSVLKIGTDGSVSSFSARGVVSVAVDSADNVVMGCSWLDINPANHVRGPFNQIHVLSPDGVDRTLLVNVPGNYPPGPDLYYQNGPLSEATVNSLSDAKFGPDGNVYFCDYGGSSIRKIAGGVISTVASTPTRTPDNLDVRDNRITAFCIAPDGSFYYVIQHRVEHYKPGSGDPTIIAGSTNPGFSDGTGSSASFYWPSDITYGQDGNVYVCDNSNSAIRQVTPAGVVTTVAGNGNPGNSDGTGSTSSFNYPVGVGTAPNGDIYVADTYNNLIRKIAPGTKASLTVSDPQNPNDHSGIFSPNNDRIKDTLNLNVNSSVAWKVTTKLPAGGDVTLMTGDGKPGQQVLPWDGKPLGNGIILPDGKYILRLTPSGATPGDSDPTATVIIDKTAPTVDSSRVTKYLETEAGEVFYVFSVRAHDRLVNGTLSDIDQKSLNIEFAHANFEKSGDPTVSADSIEQKYKRISTDGTKPATLEYTVSISDTAGNSSKANAPFKTSFAGRIEESLELATLPDDSISFTDTGTNAYSLLAQNGNKSKKQLLENSVYYSRSGLTGDARFTFRLKDQDGLDVSGTKNVYITDLYGRNYAVVNKPFDPLSPEIQFDWDGKDHLTIPGAIAHSGIYKITGDPKIALPELDPWVAEAVTRKSDSRYFAVSDHACVALEDWKKSSPRSLFFRFDAQVPNIPPQLKYRYYAHILHRHILAPYSKLIYNIQYRPGDKHTNIPPKYVIKTTGKDGQPNDLFSAFDTDNVFSRPTNPLYGQFDEKLDFQNFYIETENQVTKNTGPIRYLDMLNRMSSSIYTSRPASDYILAGEREAGKGRAMPCAFPSGKVIWVGAFEASPEVAGFAQTAFSSIFPADQAQTAFEKPLFEQLSLAKKFHL